MSIMPIATSGKIASQVMTQRTCTEGGDLGRAPAAGGAAVGLVGLVSVVSVAMVAPQVDFQLNGCY
jgi:hypothetical protein